MGDFYYILRIFDGKKSTFLFKEELKLKGFNFISKKYNSYWEFISEEKIKVYKLNKYFKKLKLRPQILTSKDVRSTTYREKYLKYNKGFRDYYICAYCGVIKHRKNITIDHIIPVYKSTTLFCNFLRKKLKIYDINDLSNLVPACRRCNSKKSAKTGFWLIRGFLGKNLWFWIIIYSIYISLFLSFVVYFIGFIVLKV